MPVNVLNKQISASPFDQNDGFSPGTAILLHIPQLDTQAALNKTHAVGVLNMSAYQAKKAPIMVIDEKTGQRQVIYAQLDANAASAATRNLMILPGSSWQDGHTYVVVLRDLRTASGHLIGAPSWFEKLRDGPRLPASERSQSKRYANIFKVLKRAKVAQDKTLYAAWDFTVASTKELTGQLLAIRNAAFSQLDDSNLGDGQVQGTTPAFGIVPNAGDTPTVPGLRFVTGSFQVPCYLQTCGDSATTGFTYTSSGLYATPTQTTGNVGTADFECAIPTTATPSNPARIVLFGHGLLGGMDEVTNAPATDLATGYNKGGGRIANANLFYGLKPVPTSGTYTGSAIEVWDSGPGHTLNPPVGNLAPPTNDPANLDPHSDPRLTPAAHLQISDFLQPSGTFVNTCSSQPCHSYDYTP